MEKQQPPHIPVVSIPQLETGWYDPDIFTPKSDRPDPEPPMSYLDMIREERDDATS